MAVGVQQIATGQDHACIVTDDDTVSCWGRNDAGQLGNAGPPVDPSRPVVVAAGGRHFGSVAAGGDSSCATTLAGAAYCWGSNADGRLGDGGTADALAPTPTTLMSGPVTGVRAAARDGALRVRWTAPADSGSPR